MWQLSHICSTFCYHYWSLFISVGLVNLRFGWPPFLVEKIHSGRGVCTVCLIVSISVPEAFRYTLDQGCPYRWKILLWTSIPRRRLSINTPDLYSTTTSPVRCPQRAARDGTVGQRARLIASDEFTNRRSGMAMRRRKAVEAKERVSTSMSSVSPIATNTAVFPTKRK